jgi:hypothetical protein
VKNIFAQNDAVGRSDNKDDSQKLEADLRFKKNQIVETDSTKTLEDEKIGIPKLPSLNSN